MSRRRAAGDALDGVLLVDKPVGPTSFTVVKRVQRALNAQRAGHTGTLDPMATGLLVICLASDAPRALPHGGDEAVRRHGAPGGLDHDAGRGGRGGPHR
ncbi:MAG: hypothetical protein R3F60_04510 [bacterium]